MERKLKKTNKNFLVFFISAVIFYAVFSLGYFLGERGYDLKLGPNGVVNTTNNKPSNVDFSLYWEAWNKLDSKSVFQLDPRKMLYGSISGMLSSIDDPYTDFFTPEENKRFREDIQGEFSGIGVEIIQKNGLPTVIAPLSGSPAEKSGLRTNDVILEVDGSITEQIGFEETISKIRGKAGTVVKLKIIREKTEEPIEVEVTRENIVIKSVEWSVKELDNKKYMYVKVKQFGDDTISLFDQMSKEAKQKEVTGLILDLRNNPGGYLHSAVDMASYFIEEGVVVTEKGKDNNARDYKAKGNAKLQGLKTVIFVNQGTASASEIVAGALKDRLGSKMIGKKTFGKGSVQELIDLRDGSAVKITVAKWFTPNGTQINGEGLKPDIEIEADSEHTDELLQKAYEILN